jgi:phosphatidylserine/phosphatidylglycerophosphate/cardiolipin synthase-like enzyme
MEPTMDFVRNGEDTMSFGELLEYKARQGVEVKILIDENTPAVSATALVPVFSLNAEGSSDYISDRAWINRAYNGEIEGVEVVFAEHQNPDRGYIDTLLFTHHQKSVIVDTSVAFVMGQNFTDGDWDSRNHAIGDERRKGSGLRQDVNVMIERPAVECAESNFVDRMY